MALRAAWGLFGQFGAFSEPFEALWGQIESLLGDLVLFRSKLGLFCVQFSLF